MDEWMNGWMDGEEVKMKPKWNCMTGH